MNETKLNALVGFAGGAGTVVVGAIVALLTDDLALGLLLGVATGAISSGAILLYASYLHGTLRWERPHDPVILGTVFGGIGLIQIGYGIVSHGLSLAIFGLAIGAFGGLFLYIGFTTRGGSG